MPAEMNPLDVEEGAPQPGQPAADRGGTITWKAAIPLLANTVILRQLFFVLGLSTLCVLVFTLSLEAFEGNLTPASAARYALIALIILGGISILAVLVMLLLYGNRYEYRFTVDEAGVTTETTGSTRRKNTVVNLLLLLSGKPGPAGAGLLAASSQSEQVKWEKVDGIEANADRLEIVLRRGGRAVMLVRCTPENYEDVLDQVETAVAIRQI